MCARPDDRADRGHRPHRLLFHPTAEGLPDTFPFPSVSSLRPLLETWRRRAAENPARYGAPLEALERELAAAPELLEPIEDADVLRRHRTLVERLAQPVFVHADWLHELRALISPFGSRVLYATPALRTLLGLAERDEAPLWLDAATLYTRILYAYKVVLQTFYGRDLVIDQPVILVVPDPGGAHDLYLKLSAYIEYLSLERRGEVPRLDDAELDDLLQNVDDIGLWMERIPPGRFVFSGFSVVTLVDVTNEVATAAIKDILLSSDGHVTEANFAALQREVRTLFRKPNLRLGLASLQNDQRLNHTSRRRIWNSLALADAVRDGTVAADALPHAEVLREGRLVAIRDVEAVPASPAQAALLAHDVRSLVVAPLRYEGRLVGLLELTSTVPGDLHGLAALKLRQIESIFGLAIHTNRERFENRVTRIIQETWTAIHPTVAWRFREAAIAILDRRRSTGEAHPPIEPIVFDGLFPLFGSADVRDSSEIRNRAVRRDLVEHLGMARDALQAARGRVPLALLDELAHRTLAFIERPLAEWSPGEESAAADLIRDEVDPLLTHLLRDHAGLQDSVGGYLERSRAGGMLSRRRASYEASLRRVNETIAHALEAGQAELQQIFPHYFELRRTDGIEHTMYVGASLVPDRAFDRLYVRNLRLRQLLLCCEIARRVRALRPSLEVPLDVAQSIVVQDAPITIGFRLEEKTFDVEGAHSVRYEIVKKRSDKARVKGTGERLAQPDRIAIIHSVEREAAEYLRYLEYLASVGEVRGDIERLELEDLPGAARLRALRFEVADTAAPREAETLLRVAGPGG